MFEGIKNRIFWKLHREEIEKEMFDTSQRKMDKDFSVVLGGTSLNFFKASKKYKNVFSDNIKVETYVPEEKGGGEEWNIFEQLIFPAYLVYDVVIGVVSAYTYDFLKKIKESKEFKSDTGNFLKEGASDFNGASCISLDIDRAMDIKVDFIFPVSSSKSEIMDGLILIPDIYSRVSKQKYKKIYSRKFYFSGKHCDWIELEC